MTAATCLVALFLPAPDPWSPELGVCLSDAKRFAVHPHEAHFGWDLAVRHPQLRRQEVETWNRPDVASQWEAECDWRRAVWDKLDDLFWCKIPTDHKLRSLGRLRQLLGDDAYFAGRVPPPIPTYR